MDQYLTTSRSRVGQILRDSPVFYISSNWPRKVSSWSNSQRLSCVLYFQQLAHKSLELVKFSETLLCFVFPVTGPEKSRVGQILRDSPVFYISNNWPTKVSSWSNSQRLSCVLQIEFSPTFYRNNHCVTRFSPTFHGNNHCVTRKQSLRNQGRFVGQFKIGDMKHRRVSGNLTNSR
eukprot:jgi/Bigna1/70500/fgenesh1_pg.12_\